MSRSSPYAWPRLTEPKLLSGFQIQTLKGHCSFQHWRRRKILHRNLWEPSSWRDFWKTKPVCMLWDAKGFMEFNGALNGAWLLVATPPLNSPILPTFVTLPWRSQMSLKGSVTGVNRSRPIVHPKASPRPCGSGAAGLSLAALCHYKPQYNQPSTC